MDKFLIEFNNISNNKYDYLRLKSVSANDEYNRLNIVFYVPYDIYFDKSKFSEEEKGEIFDICTKIIPEDINIQFTENLLCVERLSKKKASSSRRWPVICWVKSAVID